MKDLTVFNFKDKSITTITDENGEPWFVAKDVAGALGYERVANAYQKFCKAPVLLSFTETVKLNIPNPNTQGTYIIDEADLYRLVLKSKKKEAIAFSDWVTEEVLPSIRKTGAYAAPETAAEVPKTSTDGTAPLPELPERMAPILRDYIEVGKLLGLQGPQATYYANNAIRELYGCDLISYTRVRRDGTTPRPELRAKTQYGVPVNNVNVMVQQAPQVPAPRPTEFLNVRGLSEKLGIPAKKVNQKLEDLGLQTHTRKGTYNQKMWYPTLKGSQWSVVCEPKRRSKDSTSRPVVVWGDVVLDFIRNEQVPSLAPMQVAA
jgi:prophage antirepressor-like protein